MAKMDYYEILGLTPDADENAIKSAYRRKAKQYHPDWNPDDDHAETFFKEASEAFAVLSDPEARCLYDRLGYDGLKDLHPGFSETSDVIDRFADLFSAFFGSDGEPDSQQVCRQTGSSSLSDIRVSLDVTLEQAFFGAELPMEIPAYVLCTECDGSGTEPGAQTVSCPMCQGQGQVNHRLGTMTLVSTCSRCCGTGHQISASCRICNGTGQIGLTEKKIVAVPAGVVTGMQLRLPQEGGGTTSKAPRDLRIDVTVLEHAVFQRQDADLLCTVEIPFTRALLGHQIEILMFDETIHVVVPQGSCHGALITVPEKGMPILSQQTRGDLHITVCLGFPSKLTEEQRALIEQLDRIL